MADQPNPTPQDEPEVEAHRFRWNSPAEPAADVDAHAYRRRDEETPLEKPTGADEQIEADVEGHRAGRWGAPPR